MTLRVVPELAQHPNHRGTSLWVDLVFSVAYSCELTTHFTNVERWCLLGQPLAVPCSLLHWQYFPLFSFHILHTICNWW